VRHLSLLVVLTAWGAAPGVASAQTKPDFSGTWIYNQAQSARGTAGNNPVVPFPSEIHITQTGSEMHWEGRTVRQDPVRAVFKLDGSEVPMTGSEGITSKGRAVLEGASLVITSSRSYSSPAGEIVTEYKEIYSVAGDVLTVEKTQSTGGISNTLKAVYNRAKP
jgi:hypothetical protein